MKLLMECHEGRVVSLFLENGFLDLCVERGAEVLVVSPGARIPSFVEKYGGPGISWAHVPPRRDLSRIEGIESRAGRWLSVRGFGRTRRLLWWAMGERLAAAGARGEEELLRSFRPDVVFSPHIAEGFGRRLVATARRLGITTVGNLVSWDNTFRSLKSRPDVVTCWSERTKKELCNRCAYRSQDVEVVGAPAFDAYFADGAAWTREHLCTHLGLDPRRPILLYASLGQFWPFMDETGTFAALIKALDQGLIRGNPQVVLRLHPLSRLPYFQPFLDRDDVTLSRFIGYVPSMMWAPTRKEVVLAGNLLRHADVCVSPGSTMTIEPAIFDTPTVLPVLNLYAPDEYASFFDRIWLKQHFKDLIDDDLVPVVRTVEDLAATINTMFEDPGWYRNGRATIRDSILGPLDGRAIRRTVEAVVRERDLHRRQRKGAAA